MILNRHSFGIWSFIAKRAFKATFRKPDPDSAVKAISEIRIYGEIALQTAPVDRNVGNMIISERLAGPEFQQEPRPGGFSDNFLWGLKDEI